MPVAARLLLIPLDVEASGLAEWRLLPVLASWCGVDARHEPCGSPDNRAVRCANLEEQHAGHSLI